MWWKVRPLKVFGRAKPQTDVIRDVTAGYRTATMATLRVAFLSALVLELAAARMRHPRHGARVR